MSTVGCMKCGQAKEEVDVHVARCMTCGKSVGICRRCGRTMRSPQWFLDESMDWHRAVRHTRLVQPETGQKRRMRA